MDELGMSSFKNTSRLQCELLLGEDYELLGKTLSPSSQETVD